MVTGAGLNRGRELRVRCAAPLVHSGRTALWARRPRARPGAARAPGRRARPEGRAESQGPRRVVRPAQGAGLPSIRLTSSSNTLTFVWIPGWAKV